MSQPTSSDPSDAQMDANAEKPDTPGTPGTPGTSDTKAPEPVSEDVGQGSATDMPMPQAKGPAQLAEDVQEEGQAASTGDGQGDGQDEALSPQPSFFRQSAQLFLIPLVICAAAFGVVTLLMNTMSRVDDVDELLKQLARPSSGASGPMGLQNPAYKERCRVAMNLAVMLGQEVKDPKERMAVGYQLMKILKTSVRDDETLLRAYLLLAIAQIGPEGGVEVIISHADSEDSTLRFLVARAFSAWPAERRDEARAGIPTVIKLLVDSEASVASEASRVLGILSTPDDADSIEGLEALLGGAGPAGRDVRWNGAMALARLGHEQGYEIVAGLLLNRNQLKTLPETETGPRASRLMSQRSQSDVIIRSLIAFPTTFNKEDNIVWKKIDQLAQEDPDVSVRKVAQQQRMSRRK